MQLCVARQLTTVFTAQAISALCFPPIDISYTLDGASHCGQANIEAGSQALVVPTELTRSMIICVFCIAEMDKVDNKFCFMQLKSI